MGKKKLSIFLILIGCCLLASCGRPPEQQNTQEQTPTPENPPEAVVEEPQTEPEKPPEVTARAPVSGLISPTDPEKRREAIARGVSDPFQSLPTTPTVRVTKPDVEGNSNESLPPAPPPEDMSGDSSTSEGNNLEPGATNEDPDQILPATDLAKSVEITGVLEIGNNTQIILKAPKEDFSRYVQPGQYISQGQVLIKRVEQVDTNEPVVILEQSGIEIRKPVGVQPQKKPTEDPSMS